MRSDSGPDARTGFLSRLPRGENASGMVDSLLLVGARIGANVLALVWTLLLVRLVQPELAGVAFRAIALAQILSIPLTLNIESGAVRTLVPALQAGRTDEAASFVGFNRRVVALTLPILAIAALIWHLAIATQPSGLLTVWVVIGAVMVAMARMTARHATALGAMRRGLLPRLLTGPVVLACGLGLAGLAGLRLLPWHIAALFALSEALVVVIQHALLRRNFKKSLADRPAPARDWRDWVGLGLWLSPGLMMSEYRKALLIATAGLVLGGAQLSLFAVAFSIINIINFGVVAVDVAFSPRIAGAMATGDAARRDRLLAVSAAVKLAGLALGVALTLGLGHWALAQFGNDYLAAWPALLTLLLMPAISVLFGPASVLLSSRGRGRADFLGNVIGAGATVAAIALGGAMAGLTGAAIGAAVGHAVNMASMALLCRRKLGIDPTLASLRHLRPAARPQEASA